MQERSYVGYEILSKIVDKAAVEKSACACVRLVCVCAHVCVLTQAFALCAFIALLFRSGGKV